MFALLENKIQNFILLKGLVNNFKNPASWVNKQHITPETHTETEITDYKHISNA